MPPTLSAPPPKRTRSERRHLEQPTTELRPWRRCAGRMVTRAQVRLARAGGFLASLDSGLPRIERTLSEALAAPVQLEVRLADAAVMPQVVLADGEAWAIVELPRVASFAAVELDTTLCSELFERASRQPDAARTLGRVCLGALRALARAGDCELAFAPRLSTVTFDRRAALAWLDKMARHLSIEVRVAVADTWCTVRVVVPGRAVEAGLLRVRSTRVRQACAPQVLRARVDARVAAGATPLSLEAFGALARGQLLKLPALGWHRGALAGHARFATAAFEARGTLTVRGLVLESFTTTLSLEEPPMAEDATLSLLPVEVEVELTRFTLPVSELATLRPGAVVPLRHSDSSPVTLRVGGRAIARAELVDIEGEVGARILHLIGRGGRR